jgi:retinol dehydrogenase 12
MISNEFARRYGGEGIVSISLHPGNINTDLSRHTSALVQLVGRLVTYSVSYGAINSLYAGTATDAAELNGKVSNIRF